MEYSAPLSVEPTAIPGLLVVTLPVHGDNRGWFKENWQRAKMVAAGLPDFEPVQNNVSFNGTVGTTRGIHAEPWDKYVSVATGRVFGVWVDLREGDSFGVTVTIEIDPSVAVFVPRGVGNAFQTLDNDTAYSYLVNAHWSPDGTYTFVNLADETIAIPWPIPLADVELSDKDRAHPRLADVVPMGPRATVIVGASGQLGSALTQQFPGARALSRSELDLTTVSETSLDWASVGVVINATAYTAVDKAETDEGRAEAWATNVRALAKLVEICRRHRITLVHVSSDYVFDGQFTGEATESHPFSPLNVYGVTKAAGDALVATLPRHYILRTSWVIGEGANFVATMHRLANGSVDPSVINDQTGRLTFAGDLAHAISHILDSRATSGTYNVTSDGPSSTWFDIAREVFRLSGHDANRVSSTTSRAYVSEQQAKGMVLASRPHNSMLNLDKIRAIGFTPTDWRVRLAEYIDALRVNLK